MGMIRAIYKAGRAAAGGASGAEIAKEGVKGMLPRSVGKIVDKVATPENISRAEQGVRQVIDNGRSGSFQQGTGRIPTPPGVSTSRPPMPTPPGM